MLTAIGNQLDKAIGYLDLNVLGGGLFRAGVAAHPRLVFKAGQGRRRIREGRPIDDRAGERD